LGAHRSTRQRARPGFVQSNDQQHVGRLPLRLRFLRQVTSGDTTATRYLYTCQEYDAETDQSYYNHRYYDQTTGQFISRDWIVDDTANTYRYVGNNALSSTDPTGLAEVEIDDNGVVYVVPESWWFGINCTSQRYIVGQLAEFTSHGGAKYHVIITGEFRKDVNGISQPIILHYNRFEAHVDSTRLTKMSRNEVYNYIRESGFSASRNQRQLNRGDAEEQLLRYLRYSGFAEALAVGRDLVVQEVVWTVGTVGAGSLVNKLRYLRHVSKAKDLRIGGKLLDSFSRFKSRCGFVFKSDKEAAKAYEVYQRASKAEKGIVIGHDLDPINQAYNGWQAFRMKADDWTYEINMSWIDGAIDSGKPVLCATPYDKIKVGSITWQELMRVRNRGGTVVFNP
jgi:RHS repeat-associated protein